MIEVMWRRSAHGWGRRLISAWILLAMTMAQPAVAQDEDDEPLVLASGNKLQTDSISADTFQFWNCCDCIDGQVQFPVLGRTKVGENNSAIPQDRFYFIYKHFDNALSTVLGDNAGTSVADRDFSFDRYVVGVEKVLGAAGNWSVELRLPVFGNLDYFNSGLSSQFGGIGNLSVIGKRLFYESNTTAWATGLGLSAPTGADSRIQIADDLFTIQNQAVHLFPFAAFLTTPTQNSFYQGFIQLDVPTGGNRLDARFTDPAVAPRNLGSVRDQTLLYVDMQAGYWLYQNPSSFAITGLAPAITFNYTTTLEDADTLAGSTLDCGGCTDFVLGNSANRLDVLNVNAGVYTTWFGRATTYTGLVSPLTHRSNRFFDLEAQFTFNYFY